MNKFNQYILSVLYLSNTLFKTYPGGDLYYAGWDSGSVLVQLVDQTWALLVLGGSANIGGSFIKGPAEKFIIDFGPWTIDYSLDLRGRRDYITNNQCKRRNGRSFCIYTVDWKLVQEFISWLIPPWRVLNFKTKAKAGFQNIDMIIWKT